VHPASGLVVSHPSPAGYTPGPTRTRQVTYERGHNISPAASHRGLSGGNIGGFSQTSGFQFEIDEKTAQRIKNLRQSAKAGINAEI
jgi:hypothetical protein